MAFSVASITVGTIWKIYALVNDSGLTGCFSLQLNLI